MKGFLVFFLGVVETSFGGIILSGIVFHATDDLYQYVPIMQAVFRWLGLVGLADDGHSSNALFMLCIIACMAIAAVVAWIVNQAVRRWYVSQLSKPYC